MAKRQVFFSFEYNKDNWRAGQVRNMGKVAGESTFSDNDWEEVKVKSEYEIKKWIDSQLDMRSCIVVLVGSTTSERKWVNYEIKKAYEMKKGIVGIYIHNLEDNDEKQSKKGKNPFDNILTANGEKLSKYVDCYDSGYTTSKNVYKDISDNLETLIEEAIARKGSY